MPLILNLKLSFPAAGLRIYVPSADSLTTLQFPSATSLQLIEAVSAEALLIPLKREAFSVPGFVPLFPSPSSPLPSGVWLGVSVGSALEPGSALWLGAALGLLLGSAL